MDAWTRAPCPECKKSSKFYCATCCVSVGVPENTTVPCIRLPLKVDILFQDKLKKSTAPQGKVIAPQDIAIVPFPYVDGHTLAYDPSKCVVVYPSNDALVLEELDDLASIDTLIFIDCPWQKGPAILNDSSISHLRSVKLAKPPLHSKFWRYHSSGEGCISTIEAVYLMLEEYSAACHARDIPLSSTDNVADLLYFFHMIHDVILETHKSNPNRQLERAPMSEEEKNRQRIMRSQKELGKKRKRENKEEYMKKIAEEVLNGGTWPTKKCYNCDSRGHQARECPEVCKYCKEEVHFNATCPKKCETKDQNVKFTKAL
ncbi:hypothetical protein THRCLA_02371 [Thraustotheca clavata]|uniref:tRNA-uridine aminocarboxypropyltransferase 1 n=1 Tax=Thraustotheca clavata TaxID=74557 RepID=A0A1W0A5Q3_9STRA|nr:hypothetical protein THRCLA_02371 [Thraustotheca clavata]